MAVQKEGHRAVKLEEPLAEDYDLDMLEGRRMGRSAL